MSARIKLLHWPSKPFGSAHSGRRRALGRLPATLILILALGVPSCSFFTLKDPSRPWEADVSYREEEGKVVLGPAHVEVSGPRGYIVLSNFTRLVRGFAIEELAIFEQVDPNSSGRIAIEGLEDGRTYRFHDYLRSDGPAGTLVVRFAPLEQQ